jgi:hypothetical protein
VGRLNEDYSYIIEGPDGGALGSQADVIAGLRQCFGEVRGDLKSTPRQHKGLVGWNKMFGVWTDIANFASYGRNIRFPQFEAYVFDPDGFVVFHVGDKVQRLSCVVYVSPQEAEQFEQSIAGLGWTHRQRNWRDWFRTH